MKNRVEELRRTYGILQEELAAAMGVSRQSIGSIENGRYNPSTLLAIRLAHYFGLRVEDVFLTDDAPAFLSAAQLVHLPETAPAMIAYRENREIPLPLGELITGQETRLPSQYRFGTFRTAYNGSVPIALSNALSLIGCPVPLCDILLELEGNGLVLLDGYAGVDPHALPPFFALHGVAAQPVESAQELTACAAEGDVVVITYWNDRFIRENKGITTVAGVLRGGAWTFYNMHVRDTEPRTYRTLGEALRGKKLWYGYRIGGRL